jgi:hypothetical protein
MGIESAVRVDEIIVNGIAKLKKMDDIRLVKVKMPHWGLLSETVVNRAHE